MNADKNKDAPNCSNFSLGRLDGVEGIDGGWLLLIGLGKRWGVLIKICVRWVTDGYP